MTDFRPYIEKVNNALEECFPQDDERLTEAMRYSIFAGGKRVRPVLTMLACEFCGKSPERALPFACALEIIHTYSLIYDDMPCMDDDSLRRGRPTNHVVYGEAMALMAGMGLYARAYETVIASDLTDRQKLSGIDILLNASGFNGIVLGQVLDMENNKNTLSEQDVLRIHRLKTSAMLEACVLCGAVAADEYGEKKDALHVYAENIGLAFQIRDDILDVVGTKEKMGKSIGKDKKECKTTFVDIFGCEAAQEKVKNLSETAVSAIKKFGNSEKLCDFADMLCKREN